MFDESRFGYHLYVTSAAIRSNQLDDCTIVSRLLPIDAVVFFRR